MVGVQWHNGIYATIGWVKSFVLVEALAAMYVLSLDVTWSFDKAMYLLWKIIKYEGKFKLLNFN